MSSIDYKNLLDRLRAREFDLSVAHNTATAIAINGGTELVLSDPVTFDPRVDYWRPPERRLFVAFFSTHWPYWPKDVDSVMSFALAVSRHFELARRKGIITHIGTDYKGNGGLKKLLAPLRKHLESLGPVDGWENLRKKSIDGDDPIAALRAFLDAVAKDDDFTNREGGLRHHLRWFPFLGATSREEVERRERFFVSYAHAVMSTNAYKTAGAQYFGPVIHNTPTTVFLHCLEAWREGKTLREAPLKALDNSAKVASDRSHTNLVRELWGFLNLQKVPFFNQRAAEYAQISGEEDPMTATAFIGNKTHEFLAKNPAEIPNAAKLFREAVDNAKRSNERPFAVARWIPEPGDTTSFDARLLKDIRDAGKKVLLAYSEVDQAAMLLHLALDAATYGDSVTVRGSNTILSQGHKGVALSDPSALAGWLKRSPRVWIYSPGIGAQHWQDDSKNGEGSIGGSTIDLSRFHNEEELRGELEDDNNEVGDQDHKERVYWQFSHEISIGDPIIARKGLSTILGIGVVNGAYGHRADRDYSHVVPVRWLWTGEYNIHEKNSLAGSTLVESSMRKALLAELEVLLAKAVAPSDQSVSETLANPPYTLATAAADLFVGEAWLERQIALLRRKKNVILQGPPGVGKTYVAKRLAFLLMGERADDRVELVQFHPSYTYEQFVRGYRPEPKGGGFSIQNGPLYRMAERAKGDPDVPYVLVIDEINRGHLGKILGEAMMLLEADKRAEEWSVRLAYPDPQARTVDGQEERFFLPPNLYVIGTMNTADRSLAVVDYALRRRFAFVTLNPAFVEPAFRAHLKALPKNFIDTLITRITRLNEIITEDPSLGAGFQIGHSYFCLNAGKGGNGLGQHWLESPTSWFEDIIAHEVMPLVEEYWYDSPAAIQQARQILGLRQ